MGRKAKQRLWQHIARHRDATPWRQLAGAARGYLFAHEATANYQIDVDGELRALQAIGADGAAVVFDVGANVGDWTLAAAGTCPEATIHAFEPVAATFAELTAAVARLGDRVVCNRIGLSDLAEDTAIHVPAPADSAQASIMDAADDDPDAEQIELHTGDRYCAEHGIDRIDFLKVDTEGWDHRVLAGFSRMLTEGRIGAVQFEYGAWALESRYLLKDFYELLEGHGFTVGKVYPSSVAFGPYRATLEDFRGLNFLAVHTTNPTLITALR